jgi:hypothetical protein
MKYTRNEIKFIEHVKRECKKHDFKCSLRPVKYVKLTENIKCSGWFDEDTKMLVVSMNRPDWIEILAHEYSHFTQYIDQIPQWKKSSVSLGYLDDWLNGKKIKNIEYHIDNCRDLELDNEKRSVKLIKKFNLNVDLNNYVRKANAYLHFYNYIKISRRWSKPDNSPYKNKVVKSAMSTRFNMNYNNLSPRLEKIFREQNI